MFRRWFGASQTDRHYARGLDSFHRGELRAAVAAFEQCLLEGGPPDHPTTALASFYKAEAHGRLGRACLAGGAWAEALDEFESALAIQPNFPDLHFCSGLAAHRQGRPHDALRAARFALDSNPRYLEAQALVHLCHRELGEELLAEQARLRCAELAADRAEPIARLFASDRSISIDQLTELLLDGLRRRERIEQASSLLEQGFWEEAAAAFARLVEEHPNYPDLRLQLAKCQFGLGDREHAAQQLRVALQIRPTLAPANVLMGVLHLLRHEVEEAGGCFARAIERDPSSTFARYGSAAVSILRDDAASSRPVAEALAREHPGSAAALRLLCVSRSQTQDDEGAVEALLRWMASTDEEPVALLDQVALALRHGRVDLAERVIRKLPDGAPDAGTALARARVLALRGHRAQAAELLRVGCERLGSPLSLTIEAAQLFVESGQPAQAVELLDSLRGRAAQPRLLLARAFRQSGRSEDAARLLRDTPCLTLEAHRELLLAFRASGDRAQADAEYKELAELAPLDASVRAHDPSRWCEPFRGVARVTASTR